MRSLQTHAPLVLALSLLCLGLMALGASCSSGPEGCIETDLLGSSVSEEGLVTLFFRVECNGQSLNGLEATDFEVLENGEPLSSFESAQRVSSQGESDGSLFRANTLLLLDMSGSIVDSGNLPILIDAAKQFISRTVRAGQPAGLFVFDGRSYIEEIVYFTEDVNDLEDGLDSLLNYEVKDSSTNLNGAIINGLDRLDLVNSNATDVLMSTGILVVFTDGTDRANRVVSLEAQEAVREAIEAGTAVYTIGLGVEVNPDELALLGQSGSQTADNPEAIIRAFSRIADQIDNLSRGNYGLVYCSSARGGDQELTVRITFGDEVAVMSTSYTAENIGTGCRIAADTTDSAATDSATDATDGAGADAATTDATDGAGTDAATTDATDSAGTDAATTDATDGAGTSP